MNLPSFYQDFIHKSRYARWDYTKQRRESWDETVDRYFTFFKKNLKAVNNFDVPENLHFWPSQAMACFFSDSGGSISWGRKDP